MPVSRRSKPLLVGELNPYGGEPYYALYPAPDGCSGHRLCCSILGMRRSEYLQAFDRANLCDGQWCGRYARDSAEVLLSDPNRRRFVLLGSKVCSAFGTKYRPFATNGVRLILPHPSGRCRLWNEPGTIRRAREAVSEFLPEIAHLIGVSRA